MSTEGRRRAIFAMLKTGGVIVTVAALAWGGMQIASVFQDDPRKISDAVKAAPLRDLVLVTDGVLDQAWLTRTLAVSKGAPLMTLDLYQLRARLLTCGQVQSASVTRNFPNTLAVTITERPPVARLQVSDGGEARTLFIARDGTVFDGINFDPKMVETLPWLAGVKLVRRSGVFERVDGMNFVADLIAKAKLEAEHLYADWKTVSLARLESDGEIEIGTKSGPAIIFSTTEDYFRQLANLDAILDAAHAHPERPLREINLTVGKLVPVAMSAPVPEGAASADPVPATSKAPLFTGFRP
ncbi:MAG: Polypeptide-transport-associated domain protein FtsQ-type [Verrucomicrobia bacterium]|nr:Polypeptide-transport-associated domain protein FtsQ-type [Verrucomicrobiota bacterium]